MPGSHDQLDLYLDGLLPAAERQAFERRLAADPGLAALVQRQRDIDTAIRQRFAPPDFDRVISPALASAQSNGWAPMLKVTPRHAPAGRNRRRFLAVAALIGVAALGIWRFSGFFDPVDDRYAPQPWRSLETVYRDKVATGFQVDWECKDDAEFSGTFRKRLGQHLLLAQLPPDVQSLGLAYCNSITPSTVFLLTRVDGREVIVFADRLSEDKPQPPTSPDLKLFRRELDTVVLYELTPHQEPRVLPHFYNPRARRGP